MKIKHQIKTFHYEFDKIKQVRRMLHNETDIAKCIDSFPDRLHCLKLKKSSS